MESATPFNPGTDEVPGTSRGNRGTVIDDNGSRGNRGSTPDDPNGGSPKGNPFTDPITVDPSGVGTGSLTSPLGDIFDKNVLDWLTFLKSSLWTPDSNLSPQENLNNLSSYLCLLLNTSNFKASALNGTQYVQALVEALSALSNARNNFLSDISDEARLTLSEKVADVVQSFISSIFTNTLSYQSWYLQQEYNSPVNQIARLAEAGMNSAFVFSGLSSGNASSPASIQGPAQVQNSGAGQVEQQANAQNQNFLASLISGGASFITAGISAVGSLIQADCIKKLTPYQISQASSDIKKNAVVAEYNQWLIDQVRQGLDVTNAQNQISASQSSLNSAQQAVSNISSEYDKAVQTMFSEQEEIALDVSFKDKAGKTTTSSYTLDEFADIVDNGGRDKQGNQIISESDMRGYAEWKNKVKGGASLPFLVEADVESGLTLGGSIGSKDSKSNIKESEKNFNIRHSSGSTKYGYDDKANEYHFGSQTYRTSKIRKKVPLPQHEAYIRDLNSRLQKAVDHYSTLSESHQALCNKYSDVLTRNYSKLLEKRTSAAWKSAFDGVFSK